MTPEKRSHIGRPGDWTRRKFLGAVAGATAGASLAPGLVSAAETTAVGKETPQTVAILATKVAKYSHAQHFIDRFLEGYGWQGKHHRPPLKLVSMYVDQFPENDLARERSKRHNVPIYPSIGEALTRGGSKLAVDGVLIIAEHGEYPKNEMGQKLYPRHRFFKETIDVFESSKRSVPVFNDKHLSTDWKECVEMVEESRRLGFAFLAGSSLPVTWRIPSIEIPLETPMEESVSVCYGGVDSYDFHGFETAQCMSERRAGGEAGMKAIQALKGEALWKRVESDSGTKALLFAALARSHSLKAPEGYTIWRPTIDWIREKAPDATGFFVEHVDGFRTAMFLLNGLLRDFNYAGRVKGGGVISCQMQLPMPPSNTTLADFFNPLVNNIEQTILSGKAAYPVERTLLTSGMTLAGVKSLHFGQTRIETPEMKVAYRAARESVYWRA